MSTGTATPEAPSSNVKIEEVGPARKRLTITIPAQMVSARLQESMGTLATQTALPGFRKGHVPAGLLQRRFGDSVKGETRNQLIAGAYASAIEQHALKPLGDPEPVGDVDTLTLEEGKPLTFSVEVEVIPDFELPSIAGLEVKKPVMEISPAHVDGELKRQGIHLGTPGRIETDFRHGDRIGGTAKVWKNEEAEPFFTNERVLIIVPGDEEDGRGQIFGLLIEGMADILKGKSVGDTVTFPATGPEAYEREDVRGAALRIEFSIKVAERIEPATIQKVVEHYGLPGEDILREQINLALEHRRDNEQAAAMRDQVTDALADMVDFPLPEKMSAAQVTRALERARLEMLQRGLTPDEIEDRLAELRAESETATRKRLKTFFLMHKFSEHFKITVNEQEINGRIAMIAAQRGVRPDALRTELQQAGRTAELVGQIRDQKTADRIVADSKQVEISADEWNAILREKNAEQRKKSPTSARKPRAAAAKDEAPAKSATKPAAKPATKAEAPTAPKRKAPPKKKG